MPSAPSTLADVDLLDHDRFVAAEPWDVFELLRREAPVYRHAEPGGEGFWVVTRYDDVMTVLRDWETFSSELGGVATIDTLPEDVLAARRNFMETDPPRHSQFRRIFAADFTPRSVCRYEPWLRALVVEVLDAALAHEELEAVHDIAAPIPIRVLARILGLRDEHLPRLVELADKMLVDTEPEYVGDRATRASGTRIATCPSEARGRPSCARSGASTTPTAARPRDDVLSLIANGRLDGCPLSERDLDTTFSILVVAGNETTRQAIASGLLAFARNPSSGACCATTSASYPKPSRRCCVMRILSGTSGAPPPVTRNSAGSRFGQGTRWSSGTAPRTATRTSSPTPTGSTSGGRRTSMRRSVVSVRISASARTSHGSK